MMSSRPELTIFVPCRNEERALPFVLERMQEAAQAWNGPVELLLVDNGSTDRSSLLAVNHKVRVVTEPKKGYGHALRRGLKEAQGKYVLFADADGSYDFVEGLRLVRALQAGTDFVTGTRYSDRLHPRAMPWLHRYVGTPFLSFLLRRVTEFPFGECNCGMRAMTVQTAKKLALQCGGMEIASEMLLRASQERLRIGELPISYHPSQRQGPSHLRTLRDGGRHVWLILALGWWKTVPAVLCR